MKLIRLNESHQERWNQLVMTIPQSGFIQSWEWSQFKETQGQQILRLGIFKQNDLVGGTVVYCSGTHVPYMMQKPWDVSTTIFFGLHHLTLRNMRILGFPNLNPDLGAKSLQLWVPVIFIYIHNWQNYG